MSTNYFSWIQDEQKRTWLEDFYEALDSCNGWTALKQYSIDSEEMISVHATIDMLLQADHDDESYNWTCSEMQYIAKKGIKSWIKSRKTTLG